MQYFPFYVYHSNHKAVHAEVYKHSIVLPNVSTGMVCPNLSDSRYCTTHIFASPMSLHHNILHGTTSSLRKIPLMSLPWTFGYQEKYWTTWESGGVMYHEKDELFHWPPQTPDEAVHLNYFQILLYIFSQQLPSTYYCWSGILIQGGDVFYVQDRVHTVLCHDIKQPHTYYSGIVILVF